MASDAACLTLAVLCSCFVLLTVEERSVLLLVNVTDQHGRNKRPFSFLKIFIIILTFKRYCVAFLFMTVGFSLRHFLCGRSEQIETLVISLRTTFFQVLSGPQDKSHSLNIFKVKSCYSTDDLTVSQHF